MLFTVEVRLKLSSVLQGFRAEVLSVEASLANTIPAETPSVRMYERNRRICSYAEPNHNDGGGAPQ